MGKFYKLAGHCLGLLCAAAFAVQALAADPPVPRGNVSTTVNPTTGYRVINSSTIATPPNATISPVRDITPVVSKYSGGLQQTMPAGITINGVKESHPISAKVRATTDTLKGGAKNLLKGGLQGMVITAGLQQLLDAVGAIIDEGGQLQMPNTDPAGSIPPPADYVSSRSTNNSVPKADCSSPDLVVSCFERYGPSTTNRYIVMSCPSTSNGHPLSGTLASDRWQQSGTCYYGGGVLDWPTHKPATASFIDDAVDNDYEPDPDDWKLLSPRIQPDDVEIDALPGIIAGEPTIETDYDAEGNPQRTRQTTPTYELEPRDNPSPEPKIDIKTREETVIFNEYGDIISTSTTTSTSTASGGGALSVDIPTDCEFMPTVCRFLDWFAEPDPEMSDDPDLQQLMQTFDPDESSYDFGPDTMACPEPYTIAFSLLPSVEVSLQPICDVVDRVRPLVLALAYIFSGILLVRNI